MENATVELAAPSRGAWRRERLVRAAAVPGQAGHSHRRLSAVDRQHRGGVPGAGAGPNVRERLVRSYAMTEFADLEGLDVSEDEAEARGQGAPGRELAHEGADPRGVNVGPQLDAEREGHGAAPRDREGRASGLEGDEEGEAAPRRRRPGNKRQINGPIECPHFRT